MKIFILLFFAFILIFIVSCDEKHPSTVESGENLIKITHSRIYGECLGYCEKSLEIGLDSTKMIFIKNLNATGEKEIDTIRQSFKTDIYVWDSIQKAININDFLSLDSAYYPIDEADACRNRILLTTNLHTKKVDFGDYVSNSIILQIFNYEMYLRKIYGIDTLKLK